MTATKISTEDIDFIRNIQRCNCDSPTSLTLFREGNLQNNCTDFPTKYASVESLNLMHSQEANNGKDATCKKDEQLGRSLMSLSHPPTYRSLIMDIINDPPPDYTAVTGIVINVSQWCIQSPVKHLRWRVLRKQLTAKWRIQNPVRYLRRHVWRKLIAATCR